MVWLRGGKAGSVGHGSYAAPGSAVSVGSGLQAGTWGHIYLTSPLEHEFYSSVQIRGEAGQAPTREYVCASLSRCSDQTACVFHRKA